MRGGGYAPLRQRESLPSATTNGPDPYNPPSSFSMSLSSLSSNLPNYSSLQTALRGEASSGVARSHITRKGPMASYYSRRIGSAQHGSRNTTMIGQFGGFLGSSNNRLATPLPATISKSSSTGNLGLPANRIGQGVNHGGGNGFNGVVCASGESLNHNSVMPNPSAPNNSNTSREFTAPVLLPVPAPRSQGPSMSPIQSKKKSVRWSDESGGRGLVSFDVKGGYQNTSNSNGMMSAVPTFTHQKHGHEVLHLKPSLTLGNSSSTNNGVSNSTSAPKAVGDNSYLAFRPSTAPTPDEKFDATQKLAALVSIQPTLGAKMNRSASLLQLGGSTQANAGSLASTSSFGSRTTRPSLSEQLAAIGSEAETLTLHIKKKAGIATDSETDQPLFVYPTKNLSIGTLSCRYPSPARFYRDRIEYTFHHPFENMEIEMHMYYRDLLNASVVGTKLRFKLPRRLVHFLSDFDPSNPNHVVTVELGSSLAATSVREKILPLTR